MGNAPTPSDSLRLKNSARRLEECHNWKRQRVVIYMENQQPAKNRLLAFTLFQGCIPRHGYSADGYWNLLSNSACGERIVHDG